MSLWASSTKNIQEIGQVKVLGFKIYGLGYIDVSGPPMWTPMVPNISLGHA